MSQVIEEAEALHARVRRVIAGEPFDYDVLAGAIASFQARHHPGYARLCRARGVDPETAPHKAFTRGLKKGTAYVFSYSTGL